MDFNPDGTKIASINYQGVVIVADVDTNSLTFRIDQEKSGKGNQRNQIQNKMKDTYLSDYNSRCRWSTNALLYLKYKRNKLNVLDLEKTKFIFGESPSLEKRFHCTDHL